MCINTFCGVGDRKRLCSDLFPVLVGRIVASADGFFGIGREKDLCFNVFLGVCGRIVASANGFFGVGRGKSLCFNVFLGVCGRIVASANGFFGVGRGKSLCFNVIRGVGGRKCLCVNFFLGGVGRRRLCVNDFFGVGGRIVDNVGHGLGLGDGKGLLCNDLRRFGGRENAGGAHRRGGDPIGGGCACGNIGRCGGNVGRGGGEVGGGRCGGGGSGGGVGKEVEHHAFEVGEARLLQGRGGGQRERTHVGCARADGRSGRTRGQAARAGGIRARACGRSGAGGGIRARADGLCSGVARGGNDNGGRGAHADGQGARSGAMAEEVTGHAEGVVQPIARRGLPRNHGSTVVATPMAFGVVGHEPFGVELGVVQHFGEAEHLVGRGGHERLDCSLLATACFVAFLARGQGIRLCIGCARGGVRRVGLRIRHARRPVLWVGLRVSRFFARGQGVRLRIR